MAGCDKCEGGRICSFKDGELVYKPCECTAEVKERTFTHAQVVAYCEHGFRAGYTLARQGHSITDGEIKNRSRNIVGENKLHGK